MNMKIVVTGTGYVALSTATSLAKLGHNVTCVDDNCETINALSNATPIINEQGFPELLARFLNDGKLKFTTNFKEALQGAEIIICGVVTPINNTGSADNTPILKIAEEIGKNLTSSILYISSSTVPLGTTKLVKTIVENKIAERNLNIEFNVASMPEFLREGTAIDSFFNPLKIVIGTDNIDNYETILALLEPTIKESTLVYKTTIEEAELIKLASNMLVATRISYMNSLARVCDKIGAEYTNIHRAIFGENMPIYAGAGYSGECFPKDIRTLIDGVEKVGADATLLKAVEWFNQTHKLQLYNKLNLYYTEGIRDKRIAIWGLAARDGSLDIENTPSIAITQSLLKDGSIVMAYDKSANQKFKDKFPQDRVIVSDDKLSTLHNADALIILTDAAEFKALDLKMVKELMATPLILDVKNLFNRRDIEEAGIIYCRLFN